MVTPSLEKDVRRLMRMSSMKKTSISRLKTSQNLLPSDASMSRSKDICSGTTTARMSTRNISTRSQMRRKLPSWSKTGSSSARHRFFQLVRWRAPFLTPRTPVPSRAILCRLAECTCCWRSFSMSWSRYGSSSSSWPRSCHCDSCCDHSTLSSVSYEPRSISSLPSSLAAVLSRLSSAAGCGASIGSQLPVEVRRSFLSPSNMRKGDRTTLARGGCSRSAALLGVGSKS